MRGLFSLLFGASMLIVVDGARAKDENAAAVHYRSMATLFVIGVLHLYLFWSGDILNHYAMVGAVAFLFVRLPVRWLLICAGFVLALQMVDVTMAALSYFASVARDTPEKIATWNAFNTTFGVPSGSDLAAQVKAMRSGF